MQRLLDSFSVNFGSLESGLNSTMQLLEFSGWMLGGYLLAYSKVSMIFLSLGFLPIFIVIVISKVASLLN